jgi:6-pyruvoyltetrahydropterin/6-carboxytetrahydropterin synthase
MTRLTRQYRFSASHRLHAPSLSDEENRRTYGKCNNPFGHGHNYVLQVSITGPIDENTGQVADHRILDRLVREKLLPALDHGNLNDLPEFAIRVPTTENLAAMVEDRLRSAWKNAFPSDGPVLAGVRILETKRNAFESKHVRA